MKHKLKLLIEYETEVDEQYYPSKDDIVRIEMTNLFNALDQGDISVYSETGEFWVAEGYLVEKTDAYPNET